MCVKGKFVRRENECHVSAVFQGQIFILASMNPIAQ